MIGDTLPCARLLAWCDSCPGDELPSLLNWPETWQRVLILKGGWFLPPPYPEDEYYHRCRDHAVRSRDLCAHLAAAAQRFRDGGDVEGSLAKANIRRLLHWSLRDAAAAAPCPTQAIPQSSEEWSSWLEHTLATPPLADTARSVGEFPTWWDQERWARWVWVHCHGPSDWQKLHQLAVQYSERFIFDRLAEITPPDQLDAWDTLVLHECEDHGQIGAFCRWLRPEYAGVLRSHFDHSDSDWAACAYQCYLAKSPQPVLFYEWRRREEKPGWQVKLLDRRLFAPEAIRPGPVVEDIQDVEYDFRLEDPFSRRGL